MRRFRIASLAAILLLLVACSPEAVGQATYDLYEGSITGPDSITAGADSSIRVVNEGEFGHTFVVTDEDGRVVTATEVLSPGDEIELTLNLEQGSYLVSCRLITQSPDGTINDHFQLGMFKALQATG